jgi:hypothetical protein
MRNFGLWEFTCEREATEEAYKRVAKGGCDTCQCNGCRNFAIARKRIYPREFVALLGSLGIDSHKDAETYHMARLAPNRHDYGGWFHFVGQLSKSGDFAAVEIAEGFTVWLCPASAPRLESLGGMSLVQVEFHAKDVPWLLDEPEAE